ncbi:hypothetical protein RRG08_004638 [Elysia crispata]|uniref:Uncharacterized protein n=1 Tax=Elysia crispata TaxID=231223 RepID=A0AAE0ZFQ8_9GAST|nr:hypothetical protein RRG08_004638 [Elysia crispata]
MFRFNGQLSSSKLREGRKSLALFLKCTDVTEQHAMFPYSLRSITLIQSSVRSSSLRANCLTQPTVTGFVRLNNEKATYFYGACKLEKF